MVAASGGSTNAALHLPAIAHECGIKFDLFDVAEIFKRTPYIADLKPGGKYVAKDMFEAGGIPLLMKTLLDARLPARRLHDRDRPDHRREPRQGEVEPGPGRGPPGRQADHRRPAAWSACKGNLAPEGAIVKVAGMTADCKLHRPGALLRLRGGLLRGGAEPHLQGRRGPGHPLRGPEGRPRHARDAVDHGGALRPGHGRQGGAHHRRPLLRRDARLLHRPCRAGGGGRRPDRAAAATATSSRSTPSRARSTCELSDDELAQRRKAWKAARGRLRLGLSLEIRADGRPGARTAP